ncbi:MAG: AI-2E family transporter [Nitriliruptorales bacterium]|nr:AI-2E family transporter [Nitriliruptorales bacterium]
MEQASTPETAERPPPVQEAGAESRRQRSHPFLQIGRYAWATVGIVAVLVVLGFISSRLTLVVVPLTLALFPAALLAPVAACLKRHRVPPGLASLLTILGLLLLLGATIGGLVPVVTAEIPDLVESFQQGVAELEAFLQANPFGMGIGGIEELIEQGRRQLQEAAGQIATGAFAFAGQAAEVLVGMVFLFVVLFFYLKDGDRIGGGILGTFPERMRPDVEAIGGRVWYTVGRYFRGQLLIALVDAVLIGIGLLILGVPLALPLAVLVLFGGLFPIVGALVSGFVAVLVALADGGITTALLTLALIVGVQQAEGNVLEPLVLGRAISLHPLIVLGALTAGGVTLGVLGAFLAVPVAASVARVVDYARERDRGQHEPGERAATTER